MVRRRRQTVIFVTVALLTIIALLTGYAPVGAWGRFADTRSDAGLGEVPLEGKTFKVLIKESCVATHPDTWEFQTGGVLVGQAIGTGYWNQPLAWLWSAGVPYGCGRYELAGYSMGPFIFAGGFGAGTHVMLVVGIRQ